MSKIDLHMHSNHSLDGQYSSKKLIELCQRAGLQTISITDHNSVMAIEEGQYYAKKIGITLIPGIEIDCLYNEVNVHLLGYNIDYKSQDFKELRQNNLYLEALISRQRIEKINELGFDLPIKELLNKNVNHIITPEEIAEFLLNDCNPIKSELLKPYFPGGHRSDNPYVNFYWDYFATGKECFCYMPLPSIEETIQLIIRNGGTPVLAHPGITFKDNYQALNHLISLGIKGIEVFSSYHNTKESNFFYGLAKENGLFITSGSDFHGKNKPSIKLGKTNCFLDDNKLQKELFDFLN